MMTTETKAQDFGDEAAEAVDRIRDKAADAVGRTRSGADLSKVASEIAGSAREQGRNLLESAKGQATSFADLRKDDAAQSISDIANSLRSTGEGFAERPNLQGFVGSAADGLDQLADGIRDRSFAEIVAEAEDFARRKPVVVGLAALAAGFLVARFIKSTSEDLAQANPGAAEAGRVRRARARTASTGSDIEGALGNPAAAV